LSNEAQLLLLEKLHQMVGISPGIALIAIRCDAVPTNWQEIGALMLYSPPRSQIVSPGWIGDGFALPVQILLNDHGLLMVPAAVGEPFGAT
jgi:hypothetical protein